MKFWGQFSPGGIHGITLGNMGEKRWPRNRTSGQKKAHFLSVAF
jgi:hypothetical protein